MHLLIFDIYSGSKHIVKHVWWVQIMEGSLIYMCLNLCFKQLDRYSWKRIWRQRWSKHTFQENFHVQTLYLCTTVLYKYMKCVIKYTCAKHTISAIVSRHYMYLYSQMQRRTSYMGNIVFVDFYAANIMLPMSEFHNIYGILILGT